LIYLNFNPVIKKIQKTGGRKKKKMLIGFYLKEKGTEKNLVNIEKLAKLLKQIKNTKTNGQSKTQKK